MDPYEQRVNRINKEIERTLFINLALEAQVQDVQKRLGRVRRDRELLLAKVRSYEAIPVFESTPVVPKPVDSRKKSTIVASSKIEKAVKRKRPTPNRKT